jgi:hypothetical protein
MLVTRNTIAAFCGSWGSGLATLVFQEGGSVFCDNGPTGRALGDAFDAYGEGHTINNDAIAGQEIVWFEDELGLLLAGFVKYEDWLGEGLPELTPGELTEIDLE